MKIHDIPTKGYEKVVIAEDESSGLKAIIAIHNTKLGTAVGGTRYYNYKSEDDALIDVLRLSKGMTYKSALAGIDFGGGKSVIIGDLDSKTPEKLQSFGEFVDTLHGKYKCAEDVNTTVDDMDVIKTKTPHVVGLKGKSGDPSPITALGVFHAIQVTTEHKLKKNLKEIHVAIQGIGSVGETLARQLRKAGAMVTLSDINTSKAQKLADEIGAIFTHKDLIHKVECDIFAPCAMGAFLNDNTITELNCKAVVGAANNQLEDEEKHAKLLAKRNIIYAPDYLVNAGGIINVFLEQLPKGYSKKEAETRAEKIGKTLLEIFKLAEKENILTIEAANKVAEKRLTS